jgi:hypothetical protein
MQLLSHLGEDAISGFSRRSRLAHFVCVFCVPRFGSSEDLLWRVGNVLQVKFLMTRFVFFHFGVFSSLYFGKTRQLQAKVISLNGGKCSSCV